MLWQSLEWYRTRRRLEADQRAAAAQIREQAELIDKAHDAILVRDFSGRIIHANAGASRLYGWSVEDIRSGRAGPELLSIEPSAAVEALDSTQRNGEWNGELRQRTKSGAVVITASRWTLIRDQTGMPKSLLMIHSDITEKKELEARFLRTQRMNTIGSLAGGMAHDLNNALAPVLMGAELLRRKGGDEESRRTLGLIEAGALRAADMVRQVLLFARGRGGAVERVSPALLVRELEKMLRETFPKSIEIVVFVPGDLGLVRGNTTQLHQVLLNLAVNARDAMPSGGRLTLVADNVSLDAPSAAGIPSAFPGEFVVLGVTDTGTGIAPDVLQRIFEPFFTTKAEGDGTGIGLATVIHIVKAHGGFLRVDSVPGEGSTFEVFLPREPMAADLPETDATAADPRLTGNGELILVVDEERSVRELTSLELVACGYRVATATDPTGALAVLTQPGHPVRLVLLDGSRPGMDVQQTVDALRQIRPGLPVILACGDDAVTPLSLPRLRKPYAVTELLDAVRREMDRSPLATPPPRLV